MGAPLARLVAVGGAAAGAAVDGKSTDIIPLVYNIQQLSYLSTLAYLLTSIPAILSGIAELLTLIQARGPEDRAVKVAIIHAALNYTAVAGMIYNWLSRRNREGLLMKPANVGISAFLLLGGLYAGYLGGNLVYKHGLGVQRMGAGLDERKKIGGKVAPETDYVKDLGGWKEEGRALDEATRESREKAQQKAQEATGRAQEAARELRQRGEQTAQQAREGAERTARDVNERTHATVQQAQAQGARKEL